MRVRSARSWVANSLRCNAHAARLGQRGVAGLDHALDRERALDGVARGGELGEEIVAREVREAAAMLCDERGDLLARCAQRAHRGVLIVGHQARVARDVGGQNRGEAALGGLGHVRH